MIKNKTGRGLLIRARVPSEEKEFCLHQLGSYETLHPNLNLRPALFRSIRRELQELLVSAQRAF